MEIIEDKTFLFDGCLEAEIPSSFKVMETSRMELMYPYENRPQVILEDGDVHRFCTFSLLKGQKLVRIQVEHVIQSITKAIVSLYPSCLLSEPQLIEQEKGVCGWFAFRTFSREGDVHNFMYVFPVEGCMMLGTMGCFAADESGKTLLRQIMESLKVPEKTPAYTEHNYRSFYERGNQKGRIL